MNFEELKEEYGDERRTEILGDEPKKLSMVDLVREETVVITCTAFRLYQTHFRDFLQQAAARRKRQNRDEDEGRRFP